MVCGSYVIAKIKDILPKNNLAAIITAVVVGFEGDIDQTSWQILRETGTSYLVAIAGLHIGLVASVVLFLIQFLWRCSRYLPLIMPAREAGVIGGLLFAIIYAIVSGFSIPTQRSLVIVVVFSIMTLLRRKGFSWETWLWSLFVVLLILWR